MDTRAPGPASSNGRASTNKSSDPSLSLGEGISSFHLFLQPLHGLLLPQLCQPLLYGGNSCLLVLARLISSDCLVVFNPFVLRKDSYSSSPIDGALFDFRIPVTYFEESGSCFMQKFACKKLLASFCWMLYLNSGPH